MRLPQYARQAIRGCVSRQAAEIFSSAKHPHACTPCNHNPSLKKAAPAQTALQKGQTLLHPTHHVSASKTLPRLTCPSRGCCRQHWLHWSPAPHPASCVLQSCHRHHQAAGAAGCRHCCQGCWLHADAPPQCLQAVPCGAVVACYIVANTTSS